MKKTTFILFLMFLFSISSGVNASTQKFQHITLSIPETVIKEAFAKVLPLTVDGVSSKLEGDITIVKISNFSILDNKIACHIDLAGDNLHLVTKVANQDIRLKIGEAKVAFDCEAALRYDAQKQILYVRTMAKGIQAEDALKQGDIGKALLLFLNGKEFPLDIENLEPIIAQASNKTLIVQTKIAGMRAAKGFIQIALEPMISAKVADNK